MSKLVWSKTLPTTPGFWWCRNTMWTEPRPYVVELSTHPHKPGLFDENWRPVEGLLWIEWAGPLTPPEEPPQEEHGKENA